MPESLPAAADFLNYFTSHRKKIPIDKKTADFIEGDCGIINFSQEAATRFSVADEERKGIPLRAALSDVAGIVAQPNAEDDMHPTVEKVFLWTHAVDSQHIKKRRNTATSTTGRSTTSRPDVGIVMPSHNASFYALKGEDKMQEAYQRGNDRKDPERQLLNGFPPGQLWTAAYGGDIPYLFGYTAMGSATGIEMKLGLVVGPSGRGSAASATAFAAQEVRFQPLITYSLNSELDRLKAFADTLNLVPYMLRVQANLPALRIPAVDGFKKKEKRLYFDVNQDDTQFSPKYVTATLSFAWDRSTTTANGIVKTYQITNLAEQNATHIRMHFDRIRNVLCIVEGAKGLGFITNITVNISDRTVEGNRAVNVTVYPGCRQYHDFVPSGPAELLDAVQHVLEVLAAIHQHELIHRDVRWPNIALIGSEDAPRWTLIDWDEACKFGAYEAQPEERFGRAHINTFPGKELCG